MIVACGQHSLLDSFSPLSEAQRGQWCAQGCTASVLLASPRAVTPVAQSGALGSFLTQPHRNKPRLCSTTSRPQITEPTPLSLKPHSLVQNQEATNRENTWQRHPASSTSWSYSCSPKATIRYVCFPGEKAWGFLLLKITLLGSPGGSVV